MCAYPWNSNIHSLCFKTFSYRSSPSLAACYSFNFNLYLSAVYYFTVPEAQCRAFEKTTWALKVHIQVTLGLRESKSLELRNCSLEMSSLLAARTPLPGPGTATTTLGGALTLGAQTDCCSAATCAHLTLSKPCAGQCPGYLSTDPLMPWEPAPLQCRGQTSALLQISHIPVYKNYCFTLKF